MSETIIESQARKPIYKRPIGIVLLCVVVLGAIGGTVWWLYARQYEDTDDAFIDGNVDAISSQIAGRIESVKVLDNQRVKAGDILAEIDTRDFKVKVAEANSMLASAKADADAAKANVALTKARTAASLAEAEAGVASASAAVETAQSQLASAQADVVSAEAESKRRQADEERYTSLDPRGVSQAQLDEALAAADAAKAQLTAADKRVAAATAGVTEAKAKVAAARSVVEAAKTGPEQIGAAEARGRAAEARVGEAQAQLDAANLNLSYATIKSPVDGIVTTKNILAGQYVQVGQSLLAVVERDFWVTANFKETQLTDMRVGQTVDISVDAFPERTFHGHVQSIQAGTGSRFSMLPPENATGNFVKVVQRVPVKILFDKDNQTRQLLGVGMSVVPSVHITETPVASTNPSTPP